MLCHGLGREVVGVVGLRQSGAGAPGCARGQGCPQAVFNWGPSENCLPPAPRRFFPGGTH